MADIVGDEKEALLAETAAVGAAAGGAAEVGDFRTYLSAYYRHVALEDLIAAGPERLAATAIEQAKLAAYRPQGRALVRVRRGQAAACAASRDVVDIVTDDMPFLVDSIRMELTRHDVTTHLVVHPQFLIKRNVAGELHEVVGVIDGERQAHDEIAESWTHVEVSRLPDGEGAKLERDLERVLSDVRVAVEDWHRMQARAVQLAEQLAMSADGGAPASDESPAEVQALLRWLADGHFTFLGYREYDLLDGADGMALRGVPGTGLGILRHDRAGSKSFAALPPEVRARAKEPQLLILTKANSRSTVHRPSYLDYVAVKRLDPSGKVTGEYRFLGLYTHDAYTESITRIPVLRRKLTEMLAAFGFAAGGHDGKDLAEFMENYPREDLFQTTVAQLVPVAEGVLRLRERTQPRLFLRKDIYGRYMSCLLYLARDRYTTQVRLRTQEILRKALDGASTDYSVMVGETPLARLHIVVRAGRGQLLPDVDSAKLEAEVAAAIRSWDDDFAEEAVCQLGEERGQAVLAAGQPRPGPARRQQRGRAAGGDPEQQRRRLPGRPAQVHDVAGNLRRDVHAGDRLSRGGQVGRARDLLDSGGGQIARVEPRGMPGYDADLLLAVGHGHGQLQQEPVQLRLGQGIGALVLHRVLRRGYAERLGQRPRRALHRDLALLHGLEQRGLRLGRRPVDLVRQQQVREDRSVAELEPGGPRVVDQRAGHVSRHQVGRELHPLALQPQRRRERPDQQCLGHPGNAFQQHVALAQQRDQQPGDDRVLPDDCLADLGAHRAERGPRVDSPRPRRSRAGSLSRAARVSGAFRGREARRCLIFAVQWVRTSLSRASRSSASATSAASSPGAGPNSIASIRAWPLPDRAENAATTSPGLASGARPSAGSVLASIAARSASAARPRARRDR